MLSFLKCFPGVQRLGSRPAARVSTNHGRSIRCVRSDVIESYLHLFGCSRPPREPRPGMNPNEETLCLISIPILLLFHPHYQGSARRDDCSGVTPSTFCDSFFGRRANHKSHPKGPNCGEAGAKKVILRDPRCRCFAQGSIKLAVGKARLGFDVPA